MERYSIASNVWTQLAVELPYGVDMHGIVQIPGRGLKFLLFAGLDEEQNTSNRSCIIDCDNNTTTPIDDMETAGGCIVNETRIYGGYLYTYIF